jgi:uncharacterized protein (DUF433 family)
MTMIHGIIHGRTIELQDEPGLPDGQAVAVTIQRIEQMSQDARVVGEIPRVEFWMDRLVFDNTVLPGERIVKGTGLGAESLVAELEKGRSDEEMMRVHPELSKEDLQALRHYAKAHAIIARPTFVGKHRSQVLTLSDFDLGPELPTLTTKRLRFRWLTAADVPALFAIFGDAEVTRYWSHPAQLTEAEAGALLAKIHDSFQKRVLFQWGWNSRGLEE